MCHDCSIPRVRCRGLWMAVAAAIVLGSPAARGDDSPNLLDDTLQVSIGTFGINSQPSIELKGDTGGGGRIDFDRTVGGGDADRLRLDGQWRFGDRHKVRFAAFGFSRSKTKTIDEEIEWGDETFPVDAKLTMDHDFYVIEAVYDYSFLRRENYELGASIGLHYFDFDVTLKGRVESSGETTDVDRKESASIGLPAPVIGLRGLVSLTHDFWLDASAQFFALSIDEYDGNLQDYRVFVTWQPKKWLGVGAGYNRFKVDVDIEKNSFNGNLDWIYDGPMLFYSVSF